jgi:hypothetical protein
MIRIHLRPLLAGALPLASTLFLGACAPAAHRTVVMTSVGPASLPAAELRYRIHDFALRYAGIIEQTALTIASETDDADVRANLLRWQISGIPAYFKTLFHRDPYAALVDSWVLALQMARYYETGPGSDAFGSLQALAVETHEELADDLYAMLEAAVDTLTPETRARVEQWLVAHPLETDLFVRRSVVPWVAELMGVDDRTIGGAITTVEAGLEDVNTRVTVMSDFLPKQVQWMLELRAMQMLREFDSRIALDSLLDIPAYLAQVDSLIVRNLTVALTSLGQERLAVLEAIASERRAALEGIGAERLAVLEAVARERAAILAETRVLMEDGLAEARAVSTIAIDRLFERALVLVVVALLAAIVYRWVAVRLIGGRGRREMAIG